MRKVNIHEAKTQLSRIIEEVAEGEEVFIAKTGKPMAQLVPMRRERRTLGWLEGQLLTPKDFDAPLPDHHRDPIDRILIAQAIEEPARFLTVDQSLAPYYELVEVG